MIINTIKGQSLIAQMGRIKRWMQIGPFESEAHVKEFPVDIIDPQKIYYTNLKWFEVINEKLFFKANQASCWYFLANFFYMRKNTTVFIKTMSDMEIQWFVNGDSVINGNSGLNESNSAELKHGWNLIVCRCKAGESLHNVFTAAIVDESSQPIPELFIKNCFMLPGNVDSHIFGKDPDESSVIEFGDISTDWKRSNPDYVVYIPKEGDYYNDGDNEHFVVIQSPNSGDLLAFWTQGLVEPSVDNHFVLSRSRNLGKTWSEPQHLAGTTIGGDEPQASWGFPIVSKSGKLYAFYTKAPAGVPGGVPGVLGTLASDDDGISWEKGPDYFLPEKINPKFASEKTAIFIVWQAPIRDSKNRAIVGVTCWKDGFGKCYLLRFDNIDEKPPLSKLKLTWLPEDGNGVGMPPYLKNRECSEPSIVLLPDGRLFMTMRTATGHIWYSVSNDDGHTWRDPDVLRYRDEGEKINHPLSCCPIYALSSGKYALFFNNNKYYADRLYNGLNVPPGMGIFTHRRPLYITVGRFVQDAHQPIWFDEPVKFLDNEGIHISPKGSNEIGTYPSLTEINDKRIFWYPDRKYYLLGKLVSDKILGL